MVANKAKKSRTAAARDADQFVGEVLVAVEKLKELQKELEKVNEEANNEIMQIEQRYNEMRMSVYARRNEIISSFPDFWLSSFMSHPTLGKLLMEDDQKILLFVDSLHVKDFSGLRKGYCITFNFKDNPFFENTKLTKTIKFFNTDTVSSCGTKINWKEGMGPTGGSYDGEKGTPPDDFFSWFCYPPEEKIEAERDMLNTPWTQLAEMIREEIWTNPIGYLKNGDDKFDTEEEEDDDEEGDSDEGEIE